MRLSQIHSKDFKVQLEPVGPAEPALLYFAGSRTQTTFIPQTHHPSSFHSPLHEALACHAGFLDQEEIFAFLEESPIFSLRTLLPHF